MASKNNTTAKGDVFEIRVFNILQKLLQTEVLPLNCKRSKIYAKKHYKSIENKSDIIFDIAIETFMPDSDEIAQLTLIECKDYTRPIEVSKIRDFIGRMKEVKANKGYFFTTSKFQSGSIELARANHIGLAVVSRTDDLHWTTRRISIMDKLEVCSDVHNIILGFTSEREYAFAAIVGDNYYANFFDFIRNDIGLEIQQSLTIDYLTKEQIIAIINDRLELSQYTHKYISDSELLAHIINEGYITRTVPLPNKILGEIDFETQTLFISDKLEYGHPRWRFTIAHELGHIILHSKQVLSSNIKAIEDYFDDEIVENINISDKTIARMETQANLFASHLLIPQHYFELAYKELFDETGARNYPYLTIDNQPCNISLSNYILTNLSNKFNVSKTAIKKG